MYQLTAAYLFQNNYCPLPGIGTLIVNNQPANTDFVNKLIFPPAQAISFTKDSSAADDFISFIAAGKNISSTSAEEDLTNYCYNITQQLQTDEPVELSNIGVFKNSNGDIEFTPLHLPQAFTQPVIAERVIHPQAEHSILVGEKETTNTAMTEYFADELAKKDRWWIWALVIAVVAAGLIIYHCTNSNDFSFGNNTTIFSAL